MKGQDSNNDFCLIPLGKKAVKGFAKVDLEYYYLSRYTRQLINGYALCMINGKWHRMHHFIIGKPPKGFVTDHINRDRLDNRKSNLRFCNRVESNANRGMQKNNIMGVRKGVGWHKGSGTRRARIQRNGKEIILGHFKKLEDAILAREAAEKSTLK